MKTKTTTTKTKKIQTKKTEPAPLGRRGLFDLPDGQHMSLHHPRYNQLQWGFKKTGDKIAVAPMIAERLQELRDERVGIDLLVKSVGEYAKTAYQATEKRSSALWHQIAAGLGVDPSPELNLRADWDGVITLDEQPEPVAPPAK